MRVHEVLKDVRHVPVHSQPHFHLAGYALELLQKRALVSAQDLADVLRSVGEDSERHRQRGGMGQELFENLLMPCLVAPLGTALWSSNTPPNRRQPPFYNDG